MRVLAGLVGKSAAWLSVTDQTGDDVGNRGERVTPDYPNDGFYAHLSLYAFAADMARGAHVLDVGSGSGYGAHYLKTHGAKSVHGVDASGAAVAYSQQRFGGEGLSFAVDDAARLRSATRPAYDLVFSSNVLEHVSDIEASLQRIATLTDRNGAAVIAVPPCESPEAFREMRANPFHLNIWTAAHWARVLGAFFDRVEPYRHLPAAGIELDLSNEPAATTIDEDDFTFEPVEADRMAPTLTAVFVTRGPKATAHAATLPPFSSSDGSFSRALPSALSRRAGSVPTVVAPEDSLLTLPRRTARSLQARGLSGLARDALQYLEWRLVVRPAQRELGLDEPTDPEQSLKERMS